MQNKKSDNQLQKKQEVVIAVMPVSDIFDTEFIAAKEAQFKYICRYRFLDNLEIACLYMLVEEED